MSGTVDLSLAAKLFKAQAAVANIEDEISDRLDTAEVSYDDWFTDHYDGSIEITGCPGLSEEQQGALWAMGFDHAWSWEGNHRESKEASYPKPKPETQD